MMSPRTDAAPRSLDSMQRGEGWLTSELDHRALGSKEIARSVIPAMEVVVRSQIWRSKLRSTRENNMH